MTTLTDKFETLETQLASQNATIAGYVDTVETKLADILTAMEIMNENNAANTKYLLAAIGQSAACFPCPTPSIVVPPLGTTPAPINSERCQRAQALIATIHNILAAMDTLQSFNVVGTFNVLNDTISEVIGGILAGDTVPLPSFPETVNIVGDYISYAGERLFSGVGLVEQFSPLESGLLSAIAGETDASTAYNQYTSFIDASSASNGAKLLFKAVAYSALWSYFYDPATLPDLSGFDGSICGFAECMDIASTPVTTSGFSGNAIVWVSPFHGTNDGGTGAWSAAVFCTDELEGWRITATQNVRIYDVNGGTFDDLTAGNTHTCGHTSNLIVFDAGNGTPFTMTICPPVS